MARRSPRNASFIELVELAANRQLSSLPGPKQERSRERVAAIISAAIAVIARNGIAKARISDIAAEASIMPSSIYDYYNNKEELAYAIPVSRMSEFFNLYRAALPEYESYEQRLFYYLKTTADYASRNPDWARVFYLEIWPSVHVQAGEVRLVMDDYARIIVRMLEEGAEAGEWPAQSDAYMTASIIMGSLNQLIITWLLYGQPKDLRRGAARLGGKLLQMVKAEGLLEPVEIAPQPRRRPAGEKPPRRSKADAAG